MGCMFLCLVGDTTVIMIIVFVLFFFISTHEKKKNDDFSNKTINQNGLNVDQANARLEYMNIYLYIL